MACPKRPGMVFGFSREERQGHYTSALVCLLCLLTYQFAFNFVYQSLLLLFLCLTVLSDEDRHALDSDEGFSGLILLQDGDAGKTLELTLFEDKDAKEKSEQDGSILDRKVYALEGLLSESPSVENYEL